jgi:ADP-ribose pyrophosphatase
MLGPWKVVNSEALIDNRWIRVHRKDFLLPNGIRVDEYYVVDKPDIVVIVPVRSDGKTLVMREFERGILDIGYKVPAGKINPGETAADAARREFLEESGYRIGRLEPVGFLDADPGWLTTRVHVFVALDLHEVGELQLDASELFEAEWIPFDELSSMVADGTIRNIFVVAAFHLAERLVRQLGVLP